MTTTITDIGNHIGADWEADLSAYPIAINIIGEPSTSGAIGLTNRYSANRGLDHYMLSAKLAWDVDYIDDISSDPDDWSERDRRVLVHRNLMQLRIVDLVDEWTTGGSHGYRGWTESERTAGLAAWDAAYAIAHAMSPSEKAAYAARLAAHGAFQHSSWSWP